MIDTDDKYRSYSEWVNDDQWECCCLLRNLFRGWHHMDQNRIKPYGRGIEYSHYGSLSTFDFNDLTRFVVFCHENMIRGEIKSSGPGYIKLCLWKRHRRDGSVSERHPDLAEAVGIINGSLPMHLPEPKEQP